MPDYKIRIVRVFERIQPNPDSKTVIEVEEVKYDNGDALFFIHISDYHKHETKNSSVWKQSRNGAMIDLDKKALKELGNFLIELSGE